MRRPPRSRAAYVSAGFLPSSDTERSRDDPEPMRLVSRCPGLELSLV